MPRAGGGHAVEVLRKSGLDPNRGADRIVKDVHGAGKDLHG